MPTLIYGLAFLASFAGPLFALTPEDKCEASKNTEAGKYAFCRQKAEMKAIKKGAAPDFTKCDANLVKKWLKAEAVAAKKGASCIDAVSDTEIQSFVAAHADAVAAALDGGSLPECGDDLVNAVGEQCDGTDLGGEDCTTLGYDGGTLTCDLTCAFDTSTCTVTAAGLVPGVDPILPASGQKTGFGLGSDGGIEAGRPLSFTDNGDGTITDNNTGLMWEKKDDSGGIHDKDNAYTWAAGHNDSMNGTIRGFHESLNSGSGFAGYTDWRIPNAKELQSIVDYEVGFPSVDPAFHAGSSCTGCSDVTAPSCSCTVSWPYWSSTTAVRFPTGAWAVNMSDGYVVIVVKTESRAARAVRGGL